MDAIQRGKALRARRLIEEVAGAGGPSLEQKAAAFVAGAFTVMKTGHRNDVPDALREHGDYLVMKAATGAQTLSDWGDSAGSDLAAAYLSAIADQSALDAALPHAKRIPSALSKAMVATGFTAGAVLEGAPKAVRNINLSLDDMTTRKVAGIVVATAETLSVDGAEALFQAELTKGVVSGVNAAFISALGAPTPVAASGDHLEDLQAGLVASDGSSHYVVITDHGLAAALRVDARINQAGISIIGHEGQSGMLIVPSSRLAIADHGIRVRSAGHASIEMSDTPTGEAEQVSLFQTSSRALLVERSFRLLLDGDSSSAGAVIVS